MIKDNINEIKERISSVCARVKRDPAAITIVVVTKNRTPEEIKEALDSGLTEIGENKVQEALLKYDVLHPTSNVQHPMKWHMIGHLQGNKVKEAIKIFDLIQSVDSLRLAQEIDKQAAKINKIQDILLEVKTSPEATKFGLQPEEVIGVLKAASELKYIKVRGLMTIAPIVDNPEQARPYFRRLRELRDKIVPLSTVNCELSTLSMGMTDDFEVAIEEGANMIRLGRAIFG